MNGLVGADLHRRGSAGEPILQVEGLTKHFPVRGGLFRRQVSSVHAVDGVSFTLSAGETLSIVGESGCGKSTLGRCVARLLEPTAGTVRFKGHDITHLSRRALRPVRRGIQMVFQDPYASLNPRMTIRDMLAEPLRIHGVDSRRNVRRRVDELLAQVGLRPEHGNRFPHEFSGGQRQRIGIARALTLNPQLLVLDEPVSSLDVSIQAQIVNLLEELKNEFGLAYLFITHDLSVARHIADRVAVMYLGELVELGSRQQIFDGATHPYTQALLSAAPIPDPDERAVRGRIVLQGDVPDPSHPPSGCRFRTRCWKADERCAVEEPQLELRGHDHPSACHYAETRALPWVS